VNFSKESQQKVKEFLISVSGKEPTDADILECCQSLYYFGRAQYKFALQKLKELKVAGTPEGGTAGV
jgi:hypothetical protein